MNLRLLTAAMAASAAVFAVPAQAVVAGGPGPLTCSDSWDTVLSAGYASACQGPLVGMLGVGPATTATFGTQRYTLVATTQDASGRLSAHLGNASGVWGELLLSAPQTGPFVLGLQGGGTYSLYLFNGSTKGLGAIEFDTAGITMGLHGPANPMLSQAALFTAAVPEPGTYAFMLSGLLVLGLLAQRRRVAEPRC